MEIWRDFWRSTLLQQANTKISWKLVFGRAESFSLLHPKLLQSLKFSSFKFIFAWHSRLPESSPKMFAFHGGCGRMSIVGWFQMSQWLFIFMHVDLPSAYFFKTICALLFFSQKHNPTTKGNNNCWVVVSIFNLNLYLGKWSKFDFRILFKWVCEKPPTTSGIFQLGWTGGTQLLLHSSRKGGRKKSLGMELISFRAS